MAFQIERLAGEQMLARMMEVELDEVVFGAADGAGAAGIGVDLYGVAVVDDAQRERLVVERDRAGRALHGAVEIDGSLLQPELADLEVGLQPAPVLGAGVAGIAPVRVRGLGAGSRLGRHRASGADAKRTAERGSEEVASRKSHDIASIGSAPPIVGRGIEGEARQKRPVTRECEAARTLGTCFQ